MCIVLLFLMPRLEPASEAPFGIFYEAEVILCVRSDVEGRSEAALGTRRAEEGDEEEEDGGIPTHCFNGRLQIDSSGGSSASDWLLTNEIVGWGALMQPTMGAKGDGGEGGEARRADSTGTSKPASANFSFFQEASFTLRT